MTRAEQLLIIIQSWERGGLREHPTHWLAKRARNRAAYLVNKTYEQTIDQEGDIGLLTWADGSSITLDFDDGCLGPNNEHSMFSLSELLQ